MRGHEGLVGGPAEPKGYEGGGLVSRAARLRLLREQLERPFMEQMREFLDRRPIGISARSGAAARILDEGRFKSQFETGESGGMFNPEVRAQVEQRFLGVPEETAATDRPIYGALRTGRPDESMVGAGSWVPRWQAGLNHYGDHTFLLRPEVKDRSTYTIGDSLSVAGLGRYGHNREPLPLERAYAFSETPDSGEMASKAMRVVAHPAPLDMRLERAERHLRRARQDAIDPATGEPGEGAGRVFRLDWAHEPYVETQTRGGVTTDDVQALLIPEANPPGNHRMLIHAIARERGIPVHRHEDVMRDRDLQRALGLRVTAGGAGLGAVETGFEREEEEPERYQDGGRVGVVRGLAEALVEGMAPRTRQNPRGLPMDAASRRARAESMGFDLDRRWLHGTSVPDDFKQFRLPGPEHSALSADERAVFLTRDPAAADSYLAGSQNVIANFPDESLVPLAGSDDVGRHYTRGSRVIPVVVRDQDQMAAWDMDGARYDPYHTRRAIREAQENGNPGVVMENYRDPGFITVGPFGSGARAVDHMALLDTRRVRVPHATFDPQRINSRDLLAGLGGGVAAGVAAHEGLVGGQDEAPEEYQDGGLIRRGLRAFHGSPHQFDRFRIDRVGTGEGAQAYGHGLYFAENEEVARGYRDRLSPRAQAERAAQTFLDQWQPMFRRAAQQGQRVDDEVVAEALRSGGLPEVVGLADDPEAVSIMRRLLGSDDDLRFGGVSSDTLRNFRALSDRVSAGHSPGHMYEVGIDVDPDTVLDFQRPLARQPGPVQEVVRGLGYEVAPLPSEAQIYDRARRYFNSERMGRDASEDIGARISIRNAYDQFLQGPEVFARWAADGGAENSTMRGRLGDQMQRALRTGGDVYRDLGHRTGVADQPGMVAGINPRASSQALLDAGVPGLRYRDAGSRGAAAGTDNFVTFSDEPVEIIRRYARGGLAGMDVAAGNQPGHEDEVAATAGAAQRGLAQAAQLWSAAGQVLRAHEGVVA